MKSKRIPVIITILFFILMLTLTFTARTIHNRMIPNVTAARLTKEEFQFEQTLKDGITKIARSEQLLAIPKALYDSGRIFIIAEAEKNGDTRTVARTFQIEVGIENENYYEVTNQFFDQKLRFIVDSDEDIKDGDEVFVIN